MLLCLTALLCLPRLALPVTAEEGGISAASAIVLEPVTGTVLYEKDPDHRMLIASTTKIMTALVVLEHCALDGILIPTEEHAAVEGSSMRLEPGEAYTVEEVLYGLLLASGNDAAAALADYCAGSMEAFAALMNEKAAELGLENTHYMNSHGLDDPEHYSTARDLAVLTAAAMSNPVFARMFGTRTYETHGLSYENHNQLLVTCPGCVGGKTGYTRAAGRILVSVVEREGMRLICVTVSDPNDWEDHMSLYDTLYAAWRYMPLPEPAWQRLETVSGVRGFVRLRCGVPGLVVPKDREVCLDVRLPRFVFAPVMAGGDAGSLDLCIDGTVEQSIPVWYEETVPRNLDIALSAWERFRRLWFLSGGDGVYYLTK